MVDIKANFAGSIPEYYERCLGPAWFAAYARDLAQSVPADPSGTVLEIACGTGILTHLLRERLVAATRLVATDISKAMLEYARARPGSPPGIEWAEADAMNLPYADGEFAAAACGFGVMFMPDRAAMLRETRRVLRKGGQFVFNVWGSIDDNPHAKANIAAMKKMFPGDAELIYTMPYEMHDPALLRSLLDAAGFRVVRLEKKRVDLDFSAREIATGQIRGTPRSLLIEKRGRTLEEAIDASIAELVLAGGDPYRAPSHAVVVEAQAR
jgi:ubiquinone/menaquinone biosynthesis C-methylase UbiE